MKIKKYVIGFLLLAAVGGGCFVLVNYYSYIFAKTVHGVIMKVERVNQNETIIANGAAVPASQLFSFAVSIKDSSSSEIHTASSEDRQWAVAQQGQCVEAKFFPYPPWDFKKSGTYFGARLIKLFECEKK